MPDPLLLRRTAGVFAYAAVAAGWAGVAALLVLLAGDPGGGAFVVAFLATVLVPTLVALPFLSKVARRLVRGEHDGDRLLFWSLVYAPFPAFVSFSDEGYGWLARGVLGCLVVALALYATGTRSRYDPS